MAIGAYPQNIRTTGQHILNLGNEILFSAKYKGEEAQWHLERLAVIKIFASTGFHYFLHNIDVYKIRTFYVD